MSREPAQGYIELRKNILAFEQNLISGSGDHVIQLSNTLTVVSIVSNAVICSYIVICSHRDIVVLLDHGMKKERKKNRKKLYLYIFIDIIYIYKMKKLYLYIDKKFWDIIAHPNQGSKQP